ncbi:conserved hypothetical protein [Histoplasma capsulatum var. duboisii H88]|uniref:MYND-type domain-containing protein n=1 Tax=Ajellomyces capsulatus (strain H88) TaxID=544711 RepID=F0ULU3_AJEC8|nr:conserved hypothetical protein [Histoplasma capsulatum var. duboisii H88]
METTGTHALLQLTEKTCGLCKTQGNTLRCSRCQVVYYCSREHQAEHLNAHKKSCSQVRKSRDALAAEEQKLRDMPADVLFAGDAFITCVGHFWGVIETRPYMRARSALIHALMAVESRESVQMQLEHGRDMLRLCRGDNVGIRVAVPGALLQLGRDQECYDFVKWYETTGQQGDYNWGDIEGPFLDVHDADVFEDADYVCHRFLSLCFGAGVLLVKTRLLLDLMDLQSSAVDSATRPTPAEGPRLRSSVIAKNEDILKRGDHTAAIGLLQDQVRKLYKALHSSNKYFWEALLAPEKHLHELPAYYSPGTLSEVQSMLKHFPGPSTTIQDRRLSSRSFRTLEPKSSAFYMSRHRSISCRILKAENGKQGSVIAMLSNAAKVSHMT